MKSYIIHVPNASAMSATDSAVFEALLDFVLAIVAVDFETLEALVCA